MFLLQGISTMFPWQAECLQAVPPGGNLVFSAPTSAGKSLVAEILMTKRVMETGKKALLVVPFVSLAREKQAHLQDLLQGCGTRVEGFMGSRVPAGGLLATDIAVATIERANGLVNRLLEDGLLDSLACIVVDELHMVGDSSRGYLLELLLTKVLFSATSSIQIVGMSATLPNLQDLASWLRGGLYTTTFRPVPLTELVKVESRLLTTRMLPAGSVRPTIALPNDQDHLTWLCLQTVLDGHSVLVFCPFKSWVEKLAESVAQHFCSLGRPDSSDGDPVRCGVRSRLQAQLSWPRLQQVLQQLQDCVAGLDSSLARLLPLGVAFHHAGLATEERDVVEAAFRSGAVRVLVATSTLSAGVNLPARRVIIRSPLSFGGRLMERLQYQQMVGRAGRKGMDSEGESILVCQPQERERVRALVGGGVDSVTSCLSPSGAIAASSAMKRAVLEVVVSGAAATQEEVHSYLQCTLMAAQLRNRSQDDTIQDCVTFMERSGFIEPRGGSDTARYQATRLGLACLAASLGPEEALQVHTELAEAWGWQVLEQELHLIFLLVPLHANELLPKLDWMALTVLWTELGEEGRRVGAALGVEDRWMALGVQAALRPANPQHRESVALHQRFFAALVLQDLVQERGLARVASKYSASKGLLQGLQQAAATFAGMVAVFCHRLGWTRLELLADQLQRRLEFGVRSELTDLCRLPSVNGARARVLFSSGLESVATLAASSQEEVEWVISANTGRGVGGRTVVLPGRAPITGEQCAKMILSEARMLSRKDRKY